MKRSEISCNRRLNSFFQEIKWLQLLCNSLLLTELFEISKGSLRLFKPLLLNLLHFLSTCAIIKIQS